jgi:hypothetical protein
MTEPNHAALEAELNRMVLDGKAIEAFDRFYAEDVEMQENDDPPTVGKPANRERELAFFAAVETLHSIALHAAAYTNNVGFSEWTYDLTFRGAARTQMRQVAVRRWQGGKVAHERFYYKGSH